MSPPDPRAPKALKLDQTTEHVSSHLAAYQRRSEDLRLALAANELRETYGGHWRQHPEFPLAQWRTAVAERDTRLGYWEWIANAQAAPRHEVEPLT